MDSISASESHALALDGLGCTWPGAPTPALADLSLAVAPGECVLLTGPSGCGKSTLLRAAAGLLPPGARITGTRSVQGRRPRSEAKPSGGGPRRGPQASEGHGVGLLFQNVETQLLCTTVAEEVAFGLANVGVPVPEREPRIRAALEAVGLHGFEARNVDGLSAGQKQRVALAALLALGPPVLALDEPSSQLDPEGRARLADLLADEKRRGRALLVADHDPTPYARVADRTLVLKEGRIQAELRAWQPSPREPAPAPALAPDAPSVLDVSGLGALGPDGTPVLHDVAFRTTRGERVHLEGGNGAGKSTLLRALAAEQASGVLGSVGLLFQDPERNLFERSVRAEIAFTLERMGLPRAALRARVEELLERCDLLPLADRSPLTLSFGEQHRVALAAVLAPRPRLLLLDEPFAGLDLPARRRTLEIVGREQAHSEACVVVASHDALPLRGWAHRHLRIESGRIARD